MVISDPLVYVCLPILAGGGYRVAVWFVKSIIPDKPKDGSDKPATEWALDMTVKNYRQFSELLKADLNGRYMFATEARERFNQIDKRFETLSLQLNEVVLIKEENSRTLRAAIASIDELKSNNAEESMKYSATLNELRLMKDTMNSESKDLRDMLNLIFTDILKKPYEARRH